MKRRRLCLKADWISHSTNPEREADIKMEYLEFFDKLALKDFKGIVEMELQTELQ